MPLQLFFGVHCASSRAPSPKELPHMVPPIEVAATSNPFGFRLFRDPSSLYMISVFRLRLGVILGLAGDELNCWFGILKFFLLGMDDDDRLLSAERESLVSGLGIFISLVKEGLSFNPLDSKKERKSSPEKLIEESFLSS